MRNIVGTLLALCSAIGCSDGQGTDSWSQETLKPQPSTGSCTGAWALLTKDVVLPKEELQKFIDFTTKDGCPLGPNGAEINMDQTAYSFGVDRIGQETYIIDEYIHYKFPNTQ